MQYLGAISKMIEWSQFVFKAKYSISQSTKSMPWPLMLKKLWRLTRPSRTNTQKRCPSHHRGLECKCRKSSDTWSNRQVWPWGTKWSRAKANRVLLRGHTGYSKHTFLGFKRSLYTWNHQMINTEIRLIMFFAAKDGKTLYSQQK